MDGKKKGAKKRDHVILLVLTVQTKKQSYKKINTKSRRDMKEYIGQMESQDRKSAYRIIERKCKCRYKPGWIAFIDIA
jgi:hypothetical protein